MRSTTDATWTPTALDEHLPLYLAIAEALATDVAVGRLAPGQRLPPQRALARLIGVDVSTITRALAECERRGLVEGTVGRGTFVAADGAETAAGASRGPSGPGARRQETDLIEMGLVLPLYAEEKEGIAVMKRAFASLDLGQLLRYAQPAGLAEHREVGAAWLKRVGLEADAGRVLVTSGSQNAIACCLLALLSPGDAMAVDALTFPGLKTLARMLTIKLIPVPMDADGMLPDALERACRREHPRAVYLMPDFQNPTTGCLPEDRRQEIAQIVRRHNLVLVEDDAYGHSTGRHRALSSLLPEHAVYLGGLSKVFGAGLRISFVACPERLLAPLESAILSTVWMASPLNAALACRLIADGTLPRIVRAKAVEARERTSLAMKKLGTYELRTRPSGFFAWLSLPPGWTGRELELAAGHAGVRVFCAERFAVGGHAAPAAVRLSLTGPDTRAQLERGLDVLAAVLEKGRGASGAIL